MNRTLRTGLLGLLPLIYVEFLWEVNNQPFSFAHTLGVLLFISSLLLISDLFFGFIARENRKVIFEVVGLLIICIYFTYHDGTAGLQSFLSLAFFTSVLFFLCKIWSRGKHIWEVWIIVFLSAFIYGGSIVASVQFVERFSEEEFFVAVQAVMLAGFWLLLFIAWKAVFQNRSILSLPFHPTFHRIHTWSLPIIGVCGLIASLILIQSYQASFYAENETPFPGISQENPFLCSELEDNGSLNQSYEGDKVFQQLIQTIESDTGKITPDLGFLALITGKSLWLEEFHTRLLEEAYRQDYSGPSNSIKFGQFETALRAYYFHELNSKEPDLFTPDEEEVIKEWFAAVNRRTFTVEWVDWMYATAFGEWPKGPYLNQEIGASLISLLEEFGYGDPSLQAQNLEYIDQHKFGWASHFRNTDDSITYQAIWIINAFFQSSFNEQISQDYVEKSFEWLLIQALPDGGMVGYNPDKLSLAGTAYFGAQLTGDPRLLWLAGRSMEYVRENNISLRNQPGMVEPIQRSGVQPEIGSCLIYADSGTPVQLTSLAPDKIIFRSGWEKDDRYLSLNLRFTGWHRYKATNAITTLYREEPLILERTKAQPLRWLPVGRSAVRDKRIPRENLNGFIVERSGTSKMLFWLTGFGSQWAQNPPFYATVNEFKTENEITQSTTMIEWNGWKHFRKIYFVNDGPIVILDDAQGTPGKAAGIIWHAAIPQDTSHQSNNHFLLGTKAKSKMVLVPVEEGEIDVEKSADHDDTKVIFRNDHSGRIYLATVFLFDEWMEATVRVNGEALLIELPTQSIKVPLQ